jgi:hypothetical protein
MQLLTARGSLCLGVLLGHPVTGGINTETCCSRFGVGHKADDLARQKVLLRNPKDSKLDDIIARNRQDLQNILRKAVAKGLFWQ